MKYSPKEIVKFFSAKKENFWLKEREKRALNLFHSASHRVPAYKDFLKKNKINPNKIKTFKDFQMVPTTNKNNYLRKYSLEKLVWDKNLKQQLVFTATSGSTGKPYYFPYSRQLTLEASIIHQIFLKNGSRRQNGPILIIVGFGMGVWIAGLFTYQAFEIAADRSGHPISIITPGVNKIEILHALKNLAPHFQQVILTGYPPFIKDIIDESRDQGIDLKKMNLRFLFAAEAFTENFRDYLAKKANIGSIFFDTLNIYGSADIGAMAYETPTAILARRLAIKNKNLFKDIFLGINKTPTLAQYNPLSIVFEAPKGNILLSGDNAVPLIRYEIGDSGGVFSFGEIADKLKNYGINFEKEAAKNSLKNIYQLPFVYLYERKDFSTTLYGLNVYPEPIKEILIKNPFNRFLTGKFVLITKYDKKQNQYLEINFELRKNKTISKSTEKTVLKSIISVLRQKNSEFRELHNHLGEKTLLRLVFWPAEHPTYFKSGIKQKWVKK